MFHGRITWFMQTQARTSRIVMDCGGVRLNERDVVQLNCKEPYEFRTITCGMATQIRMNDQTHSDGASGSRSGSRIASKTHAIRMTLSFPGSVPKIVAVVRCARPNPEGVLAASTPSK